MLGDRRLREPRPVAARGAGRRLVRDPPARSRPRRRGTAGHRRGHDGAPRGTHRARGCERARLAGTRRRRPGRGGRRPDEGHNGSRGPDCERRPERAARRRAPPLRAGSGRAGSVAPDKPAADWFDQLNRDPRARSVAGIATRVLRRNVEDVMAAPGSRSATSRLQTPCCGGFSCRVRCRQASDTRHLTALSSGRLVSLPDRCSPALRSPARGVGSDLASRMPSRRWPASALPPGSTLAGVGIGLRRAGAHCGRGRDRRSRQSSSAACSPASRNRYPSRTGRSAFPAAEPVLGAAAETLLDARLQAAAAAADLASPPAGADATTTAKGLDSLAAAAGGASLASATKLADRSQSTSLITSCRYGDRSRAPRRPRPAGQLRRDRCTRRLTRRGK